MKKEIIVSRYKEDCLWLLDQKKSMNMDYLIPITIYNHLSETESTKHTKTQLNKPLDNPLLNQSLLDHPLIDIVNIPNVGRESNCYLEHICRNYDDLADWSYFTQADPHQDPSEFWPRLEVDYQDTTPLTSRYLKNYPSPHVKAKDRIEQIGNITYHWGLADHHGDRSPRVNRLWLSAVWAQCFACPQPNPWWFGYAASYAVPKKRILDRPLEFWLWLRDLNSRPEQQKEKTTASAWALETIWGYLWGDAKLYPVHEIPQEPGTLNKLGQFLKAGAKQITSGNKECPQEVQDEREKKCYECDIYHDHELDACYWCGCGEKKGVLGKVAGAVGVDMKMKRRWASQRCPIGKWERFKV